MEIVQEVYSISHPIDHLRPLFHPVWRPLSQPPAPAIEQISDKNILQAIFCILGHSTPVSVESYKRYLSQRDETGLLGVYEVLHGYTIVRGQGIWSS
ncbi:hypothetical protein K443DRAFT_16137 [Laccaria amethystina LaAM-08-1]|uniref:Uncharacterized protein n=1 Tax=Laccaria amethystina LaAM-08-1 TaxID=1095629 RepID=A0A0C9WYC9_9AGAR|nr:hypothetical protein K443DRAFT_16137 [Laccaria amethystina LaAM-08-1]